MTNKCLSHVLKNGKSYCKQWKSLTEVHDAAYEKKKFIHLKQWNEILKLPGNAKAAEKKAKAHANDVAAFFVRIMMRNLMETDNVFRFPMNLFHLKVVPKGANFVFRMIPTENGLIHSKFVPYIVSVPTKTTKYIHKNKMAGRKWSNYEIDIDLEHALSRRKSARAKKRVLKARSNELE